MANARLRLTGSSPGQARPGQARPGQARPAGRPSNRPSGRPSGGKRIFDLVAGSVCLVVLSPLLAAVALLVRLTTPGPALFRQTRLGQERRPFTLCKFRTMYDDCGDEAHRQYVVSLLTDESPPAARPSADGASAGRPPAGGRPGLYKLADDERITPLGHVLRRLSLDELPQLFNVIKGDMSLVGPRPALPWEAELFRPPYDQRFVVMPGMTGLWQVSGRSRLTFRQALELDVEYARRHSFALDLVILLRTIPAVLTTRGAL